MLTISSTAGINMGRIIQTKMCPVSDLIYCLRDSSMFIEAEMTAGILVACVPTFGPLIFRRSVPAARPQHDLPTIGSVRMRPRRNLAKFHSLLWTIDRSYDDHERENAWNMEFGPPASSVRGTDNAIGPGILVTHNLDVHSLNVPSQLSETSTV
jgi:hypothetical protein